ncbi:MAG: aldolase [Alphaproteobacteria bacterium]|jgi:serine kinase of HPr protein (carbohydrate metabolism regulator)|nr:aldolase [Alphaproteobacteria bacterium]
MSETVHASTVAIGGRGVLIFGRSGAGKSDLALRLIDRGAHLVSDDYTVVSTRAGALLTAPPDTIAGKMELRGVGIIDLSYESGVPAALIVDLDQDPDRLPEPGTRDIAGVAIPVIALHGLEPSAPIKVERALLLHGLASPCPN